MPVQRHMLRRLGLLHRGSPRILLHHQESRRRRENRSIKMKAADGMIKVSQINSHFTLGRAKGTKAKERVPNMAKDMTKVTNHRIRAKDMEARVLEVGNGTITNGRPVRRKPHIKVVNRAVRPTPSLWCAGPQHSSCH